MRAEKLKETIALTR